MPGNRWMPWVAGRQAVSAMSCPMFRHPLVRAACAEPGATPPAPAGSTGGMTAWAASGENMRIDEVVAILRKAEQDRRQVARLQEHVQRVDAAMESLGWEDQQLIRRLVLDNRMGQVEWLCQQLEVEPATVYRRRNRALKRLGERL